jgi:hypothetical protein
MPFILTNQYIGYSDHLALRLDDQEILGALVALIVLIVVG